MNFITSVESVALMNREGFEFSEWEEQFGCCQG